MYIDHSVFFFFSSRRRYTSFSRDWSSDVCSSDLEACGDAVGDLTLAEARGHRLAQDLARDRIGELGLEAIADLEPHLPVFGKDQEDHAIVEPLLADTPGLGQTDGVVLETLALERAEDGDDDLIARSLLTGANLVLEPRAVLRRQHAGVVVDPTAGGFRNRERGLRDDRRAEQKREDEKPAQAHGAATRRDARTSPSAPARCLAPPRRKPSP